MWSEARCSSRSTLQLIDHLAPRHAVLWLSIVQYVVVAVSSIVLGALFESWRPAAFRSALPAILYGGFGSISIAYTLQIVAQRRAEPSHAAILLSLEGSFAALGGWLILGETLSPRGVAGCGLLLIGMILSQLTGLRRTRAEPVATPPGGA